MVLTTMTCADGTIIRRTCVPAEDKNFICRQRPGGQRRHRRIKSNVEAGLSKVTRLSVT